MKILALDTSGPVAAVALAEETEPGEQRLIGGFRLQSGFTHSQTLMPMLEKMKALADIDLAQIDYIAVAAGPGSFTGLRIGASAAKGLAFALEKKIVPVPTLDAMAYQMAGVGGIVCPMMDARRGQVYTGVYGFVQAERTGHAVQDEREAEAPGSVVHERICRMEKLLSPCAMAVSELIPEINRLYAERTGADRQAEGGASGRAEGGAERKTERSAEERTGGSAGKAVSVVWLTGDGVPVSMNVLREGLLVPYAVAPLHRDRQSAEVVCALAFDIAREGKAIDADSFVPEYLRPFISGPKPAHT